MGNRNSRTEGRYSQMVRHEINEARNVEEQVKKLLLLGTGGSGKSTFFKQFRRIEADDFTDVERHLYRAHIHSQIMSQIQNIIERCDYLYKLDPENFGHLEIPESAKEKCRLLFDVEIEALVTSEQADAIEFLWQQIPAFREAYDMRALICVFDSSEYFFNHIQRVAQPNYVPTDDDILYLHHRTSGMSQRDFLIQNHHFRIMDVGGQRSERRKWIHYFDDVTAVIFVVSLSCYDEVLFENEDVNQMVDTLKVFSDIINNETFKNMPFLLFLNKNDLFEQKIRKIPLDICFRDVYESGHALEAYKNVNMSEVDEKTFQAYYVDCLAFLRRTFESKNTSHHRRSIYIHVTCATNKDNVTKIFSDTQHVVINDALRETGMVI